MYDCEISPQKAAHNNMCNSQPSDNETVFFFLFTRTMTKQSKSFLLNLQSWSKNIFCKRGKKRTHSFLIHCDCCEYAKDGCERLQSCNKQGLKPARVPRAQIQDGAPSRNFVYS